MTYDFRRGEMLRFLPGTMGSLLDVGCASGRFLRLVKERFLDAALWGIDPVKYADESSAFQRLVGRFPDDLPSDFRVDCIVFNDVLEHLVDPWDALRSTVRFLAPDGKVVASIPNIRHYNVVCDLVLHGRWEYVDKGILDRTHLRFFTRSGILDLFERSGFRIVTIEPLNINGPRRRAVNRLLRGRLENFLAPQYAVVAVPAS